MLYEGRSVSTFCARACDKGGQPSASIDSMFNFFLTANVTSVMRTKDAMTIMHTKGTRPFARAMRAPTSHCPSSTRVPSGYEPVTPAPRTYEGESR